MKKIEYTSILALPSLLKVSPNELCDLIAKGVGTPYTHHVGKGFSPHPVPLLNPQLEFSKLQGSDPLRSNIVSTGIDPLFIPGSVPIEQTEILVSTLVFPKTEVEELFSVVTKTRPLPSPEEPSGDKHTPVLSMGKDVWEINGEPLHLPFHALINGIAKFCQKYPNQTFSNSQIKLKDKNENDLAGTIGGILDPRGQGKILLDHFIIKVSNKRWSVTPAFLEAVGITTKLRRSSKGIS